MLRISNYQTQVPTQRGASEQSSRPAASRGKSFASELKTVEVKGAGSASASSAVQFSKHALQRMHSRGVTLSPAQVDRLSEAMDSAGKKGARETLILTNDAAFVVSPSSRTVISAFDRDNLREGVFTEIDSAVIL